MNEQQFFEYRNELRKREKSSGKTLWLATYSCFIYMLFASFNIAGKMFMSATYVIVFSFEHQSELGEIKYEPITISNIQWFCYQIIAPLSLPLLPHMIGRMKFRFILLISSGGPILFLLPALFASKCEASLSGACSLGVITGTAILLSFVAGFFQAILLFAMLYYISNISNHQEKIIYYGSFYFINSHSFQWLLGSLVTELLANYANQLSDITRMYIILIICQVCVSLMYITLPEDEHKSRFSTYKNNIFNYFSTNNVAKKDSKNQLRELLLSSKGNDDDDEEDGIEMAQDVNKKKELQIERLALMKEQKTKLKKSLSYMTLQCFSIEEQELQEIMNSQIDTKSRPYLTFEDYQSNSYVGNIKITWKYIQDQGFVYMGFLIWNIACIEAFLLIYFAAFTFYPNSKVGPRIQVSLVYQGYLYVGIGELFGCFGMGLFGDFKDKLRYFAPCRLGIFQFGCLIAWTSYKLEYDILVLIFSCAMGFCDSAMTATVISFHMCEFSKLIFLVDLIYLIYSTSFAVAALLLIVCNYTSTWVSLTILQVSGLLAIFATCRIKNNSVLRMKLSK